MLSIITINSLLYYATLRFPPMRGFGDMYVMKIEKKNTTHPPPKNTPSRKLNLEPLMTPQEWIDKGRSKNCRTWAVIWGQYIL